jgi:integrase
VRDGWDLYLQHCQRPEVLRGVSKTSLKRYRAVRDKHVTFCDRLGINTWMAVSPTAAKDYASWLARKGYADRSIYLELTLLKSVILWLIEEKHLPASCRLTLPLRKPQGTDTYCFTREQVAAMVRHCSARPELRWLEAVIIALACTGLRIGELAALRWSDVDLRSDTIRITDERSGGRRRKIGSIRTTKGRRDRTLPINPALQAVLLQAQRSSDGLVFHGPRKGRLKPDTVRVILAREVIAPLAERFPTAPGEVGFEHATPHSFRHFFCSQAFSDGAPEADIKDWLGHRDSKMVAHYRHLRAEDSHRKMKQIDFLGFSGREERSLG